MPDLQRLSTFIEAPPTHTPGDDGPRVGPLRHVIEFRHESGVTDEVLALRRGRGVGVCLHDMPGGPVGSAARGVTGDTIYLRFHGGTGRYSGGRYADHVLGEWAAFRSHGLATVGVAGVRAAFERDQVDVLVVPAAPASTATDRASADVGLSTPVERRSRLDE